jgi:hypothetical protein
MEGAVDNEKMILALREMKRALYTSDAVTDTVFMPNSDTTVCEQIDDILIALGAPEDEVVEESEALQLACTGPRCEPCYGTGQRPNPNSYMTIECNICNGRGKV